MNSESSKTREAIVDYINGKWVEIRWENLNLNPSVDKDDYQYFIPSNDKESVEIKDFVDCRRDCWRVSVFRRPHDDFDTLCLWSVYNKVLALVKDSKGKLVLRQMDWPVQGGCAIWEFTPHFAPKPGTISGHIKMYRGFKFDHTLYSLVLLSHLEIFNSKWNFNCDSDDLDDRSRREGRSMLTKKASSLAYQLFMKNPKMVISLRSSCYGTYLTASQDGKSITHRKWYSEAARWTLMLQPTGLPGNFFVYLKSTYNKVLALDSTGDGGFIVSQMVLPTYGRQNTASIFSLEIDPSWPLRPLAKLSTERYQLCPDVDGTFNLLRKPNWDGVEEMVNWVVQVEKAESEAQNLHVGTYSKKKYNFNIYQSLPSTELGGAASSYNSGHNVNGSGTQNIGDVSVQTSISRFGNFFSLNNDDSASDDHD